MIERLQRLRVDLWLTAALTIAVCVLTLLPPGQVPRTIWSDKVSHALAFGGLVLPVAVIRPRALWLAVVFSLACGAAIEWLQPLSGRQADFTDFVADMIGVFVVVAVSVVWWSGVSVSCRVFGLRDRPAR